MTDKGLDIEQVERRLAAALKELELGLVKRNVMSSEGPVAVMPEPFSDLIADVRMLLARLKEQP